jgi:tetratricopeptide (TPR) repeat protein
VKLLGDEHPEVAQSLNNLAAVYQDEGKLDAALPLFQRSLAIQEKALEPTDPLLAIPLGNLGFVYKTLGKFGLAEPLYVRALSISEKALGAEHPNVIAALNNLAELCEAEGQFSVAEPLLQRALSIREKVLGAEHADVALSLNNLAELYREEERFAAAEPLLLRSVAIFEKALGPEHPAVARILNNFAELYLAQGRRVLAEPPLLRSVAIWEKALGPQHPDLAKAVANLAALRQKNGKPAAAEPLYKRSLAILEAAFGPEHPGVAAGINNLAGYYQAQGQFAAAEPLYRRSLAVAERALGPLHPSTALALNNLASLYQAEGKLDEARPLYERSLAIYKTALGEDHPNVAMALANLATLSFDREDWAQAASLWQQSTALIEHRAMPVSPFPEQPSTIRREDGLVRLSAYFRGLIKASYRSVEASPPPDLIDSMFLKAQWSTQSDAAEAMAQMAARGVKGNTKLAGIIRDRQDLLEEWQARTIIQLAAFSKPSEKRNADTETANSARLHDIAARIQEIDAKLKAEFIDYAELASPEPVSIEDLQGALNADEALILFLDTEEFTPAPEETFVWVVTKTDARWFRSKLGTSSLEREVTALRCGLDYGGSWEIGNSRCPALTQSAYTDADYQAGKPLPFDLARSHALYKELLGPADDLIKGKSLLVVPSGPLTQLPFQVLTSEAPESSATGAEALHRAHWLIRDHALTVLPSASSLKTLRRQAKPSDATRPMIGFVCHPHRSGCSCGLCA